MIKSPLHKCLYEDKCKYGGVVDTDKHAYSMKSINGEDVYWHYLCYIGSQPEVIYITHDSFVELLEYIKDTFDKETLPRWAIEVVRGSGDDESIS